MPATSAELLIDQLPEPALIALISRAYYEPAPYRGDSPFEQHRSYAEYLDCLRRMVRDALDSGEIGSDTIRDAMGGRL